MSRDPEIAVIVYAYNRREYLPCALRSLAKQTLERKRFEVVVVKNFTDPECDRSIAELGAVSLLDETNSNGHCMLRGIRACRAPILTFLDDDDEYEPDRLDSIVQTMRKHPDVGFYRNRVNVIDAQGQPIPESRWRAHERDALFDSVGPIYLPPEGKADLLDLTTRRTTSTFNSSSMALRRELLEGDVGETLEMVRINLDFLFLLAGAISPLGVYLDHARLTRFRFAPKALYRLYTGNSPRTVVSLRNGMAAHRAMSELAARHGRPDFAEYLAKEANRCERFLLRGALLEKIAEGAPRPEILRPWKQYARFLLRDASLPRPDVWKANAYALSYLCAPRLTSRLARTEILA
jgi:glycosyltransferase involved in cell wall biosynthesis